jgi:hypothetical protein
MKYREIVENDVLRIIEREKSCYKEFCLFLLIVDGYSGSILIPIALARSPIALWVPAARAKQGSLLMIT